jgi:hypothetical protein
MIPNRLCNKVYFSDLMPKKAPVAYNGLVAVLDRYEVNHDLLPGTSDIWCRDYLPAQIEANSFCLFSAKKRIS